MLYKEKLELEKSSFNKKWMCLNEIASLRFITDRNDQNT